MSKPKHRDHSIALAKIHAVLHGMEPDGHPFPDCPEAVAETVDRVTHLIDALRATSLRVEPRGVHLVH